MNPAEHEARKDAERSGQVVGSDVDRVESDLLAELAGDDAYLHPGGAGAWLAGEAPVPSLWGVADPL